jgi:hypothetical protein
MDDLTYIVVVVVYSWVVVILVASFWSNSI